MSRYAKLFVVLFLFAPVVGVGAVECPDGYTQNLAPDTPAGYMMNARGRCVQLCQAPNMAYLKTDGGYSVELFAAKGTTHAIGVEYNNNVCYADLAAGSGDGIQVEIGTTRYHTVPARECLASVYRLTYSCGEGATGNPPVAETLQYGALFSVPYQNDGNTCFRPGYRISQWMFDDGTSVPAGGYLAYTYQNNRTATAVWEPVTYTIYFDCGSKGGTATMNVQYGQTVTPGTTCSKATSYAIRIGMYGTGETISASEPFVYNYTCNIVLEKQ